MFKETYNLIGIMSGTSLDGVDLIHLHLTYKNEKWNFELFEKETITYSNEWLLTLKKAVNFSKIELIALDRKYTLYLGEMIRSFVERHKIEHLDAVCSHGHTILHQPNNGITLQIGNLSDIATYCNQLVVCDFRIDDVKLGGQGAPLVPIGDRLLFSEYTYCLNLGGFSNVSFEYNGNRIAFDISPVNTVLNYFSNKFGKEYDDNGSISRSGNSNPNLYLALNNLDYYSRPFPKSLGYEFVQETILPLLESFNSSDEDKMCTFTEHVAYQISNALPNKTGSMLITGGGAYNDFLIQRIRFYLPNMQIEIPNNDILEFKEALIFALLGVLKLRGEINVLSSVTGSKYNHCSGKIYHP